MPDDLNKPLPYPNSKWEHRFAFLWYNDQEILHDSEKDIERKVKVFADQGINHLITFSCTHFRWSFRRDWDKINAALSKIVIACHKHNIYLTEHHSSNLNHHLNSQTDIASLEVKLKKRKCSLGSWPNLVSDCSGGNANGITDISKFYQIDGGTGEPLFVKTYESRALCFNNQEYVKEYLKYLETVYALGVDGIMTDDAQYFENACACEMCQKLFYDKYGMRLPSPSRGTDWIGNYNDPAYRNWADFRKDSVVKFHVRIKEHYESLELRLLRPSYVAHALYSNPLSYCLDKLPALDWVFQECCYSTIIKYSWPSYMIEQAHRVKIASKRKIPHMIMFYADRADTMTFTWGLSKLSGSLYTNTPEGERGLPENLIRRFESANKDLFLDTEKIAQIAFYDSLRNREQNPELIASRMKFWAQSCLFKNIPFELTDSELSAGWTKYNLIILNETGLLDESEIKILLNYVKDGGTLVISGTPGHYDSNGNRRDKEALRWLWNSLVKFPGEISGSSSSAEYGRGKIISVNHNFGYPGSEEFKKILFIDKKGSGTDVFLSFCWQNMMEITDIWADKWGADKVFSKYDGKYQETQAAREQASEFISSFLNGTKFVEFVNFPELLLASPFLLKNKDIAVIHLLNASKCFDIEKGATISHDDLISFKPFNGGPASISLDLLRCGFKVKNAKAEFLCPGQESPVKLESCMEDGKIRISIPLSLIKDYGTVKISG